MKYFCTDEERSGTCYHEFYKGKFDGHSFWQKDSLLIDDNVHCELGMAQLFWEIIPGYDVFDEIEVNKEQWDRIKCKAKGTGGALYEAILEADIWVQETFKSHSVFTMVGI